MKLLLVDGLNLVRRIQSAIPDPPEGSGHQDAIDRIADSCSHSLGRALGFHHPSHCIAIFEQHGHTWRHEILPQYKENRSPMPEILREAMPAIQSKMGESAVKSLEMEGYEADDVIATLACGVAQKNGNVVILTTDRIQCQLLSPNIRVYDHFGERFLDEDAILEKFGVRPGLIPDLMALAGDSSVSIQGVRKIGIKTAARLLNEHGSLTGVFESLDSIRGAVANHLIEDRHQAEIAYQLFCLKSDINLGVNLKDFRIDIPT